MPDAKPTIEQVLAASATHSDLRASLLADPRAALRQFGIEIREGVEIRVAENTPEVLHLALPPASPPVASDDLSDEQLEAASGGGLTMGPDFDLALANQQMDLQDMYRVG